MTIGCGLEISTTRLACASPARRTFLPLSVQHSPIPSGRAASACGPADNCFYLVCSLCKLVDIRGVSLRVTSLRTQGRRSLPRVSSLRRFAFFSGLGSTSLFQLL
jgi:hypothetical protein